MVDAIGRRYSRLRNILVSKVYCISNLDAVRCFGCKSLVPLMLKQHANTPSIFSAEIPQIACIRLEMRNNAEAQGPEGRDIVVEGTFEEFVG